MWLDERTEFRYGSGPFRLLRGVLSCGYCLSVWLAFFETARRRPRRFITSWMAVSAVAALPWAIDRVAVNTEPDA
jgi:hypothetical protein